MKEPTGAYTTLADLIQQRFAAREIELTSTRQARNLLAGLVSSSARGQGIDFAEVRAYEAGDDVRAIDWRVTARTGKPHTKLFQADKERPVFILADQSDSMFFGSRRTFKSVVAAHAAALIAWSALSRGDRVGGFVFAADAHREIRPRRSKKTVLRLLNELNEFNHRLSRESAAGQRAPGHLTRALENARRLATHSGLFFIVSDFSDLDETAQTHLEQLSRFNEVVGLQVYDPMESELPPPDVYTITNGAARTRINTHNSAYRDAFHGAWLARQAALIEIFRRCRGHLIELTTDGNLVDTLRRGYIESVTGVPR